MGPVKYFVRKNVFSMSMAEDGENKHPRHVIFMSFTFTGFPLYPVTFETPTRED